MEPTLPKNFATRKEEITADFLKLVDSHMNDLLNNRVSHRFYTSDFAKLLFIHPRHLTNTVKLTMGRSPCDIMEERLLDAAQTKLRETKLSIGDIGIQLSYNDPTNFTKFFKSLSGMTPLQYRKTVSAQRN